MGTVLTSWQAIARYLGKGIRTVQRWEDDLGLPIRRPNHGTTGVVFAMRDEIDSWIRSHPRANGDEHEHDDLEILTRELAELKQQNELLRARLERAEGLAGIKPPAPFAAGRLAGFNPYQAFRENPLLAYLLRASIAATLADFGNVQLFDSASRTLRIVKQQGFGEEFLSHFDVVSHNSSACGAAMLHRSRVVVNDVETDPLFHATPSGDVMLRAGVRSVQSTPLIGYSGELIGMVSTHYARPYGADQRSWKYLDHIIAAFLRTTSSDS